MTALRLLIAAAVFVGSAAGASSRTVVRRVALRGIDFGDAAEDSSVAGMNDVNPGADNEVTEFHGGDETDEQWQAPPPEDESQPRGGSVTGFADVDVPTPRPQQVVMRMDPILADPGTAAGLPELADSGSAPLPGNSTALVLARIRMDPNMTGASDPDMAFAVDEVAGGGPGGSGGRGEHVLAAAQVGAVQAAGAVGAAAAAKRKRVLREFDDQAAEHDAFESKEDLTNDAGAVRDGEEVSLEDQQRLATGDISRPKRKAKPHPKHHPRPAALPQRRLRKTRHAVPVSLVAHKLSATEKLHQAMAAAASMKGSADDRMAKQCQAFVDFVSGQSVKGTEFIRMFKGTCDGAIRDGTADMAFTVMCNSLGAEVEPLSVKSDFGGVCPAILKVFNEAGIGK